MDLRTRELLTECLSTPEVVRTVLQHFPTSELFQLSVVNKTWKFEARSVLRDQKYFTKELNRYNKCQDLTAFASDLQMMKEHMRPFPVCGLTIYLGRTLWRHGDWCTRASTEELDGAYEDILNQIPWRHLSVVIHSKWAEDLQHCPGFLLVKKVLTKFGSVLEKLTLTLPDRADDFVKQFIQSCCSSFQRLKILKIGHCYDQSHPNTSFIKAVVASAPNLQILHTTDRENLHENLLEGSSAIHVTDYPHVLSENAIPERVAGKLRMREIILCGFGPELIWQRINRSTSKVLQASRTTLSSMSIDKLFLIPLMTYGLCLKNVKSFTLNLSPVPVTLATNWPHIWRLVKYFDFTRIFPNLIAVDVELSYDDWLPDQIDEIIEHGNATVVEPVPDRAVNIKTLRLKSLPKREAREDATFRLIAELFPDVQKLEIETDGIPISQIRDIWVDLKEVHILLSCSDRTGKNFDSEFCGIFPEEVAYLQGQDEEYLRRVNIVPVMPCVAYVQGLRTFGAYGGMPHPDNWFSKVTDLIVFQRCPALTVTAKT